MEGDRIVLLFGRDRYLVRVERGIKRMAPLGVVDLSPLIGASHGTKLEHGGKSYIALAPSVEDLMATISRKAQIVLPKDVAQILLACDVKAGRRVVEAGVGSAALTTALAWAVSPGGRVHTYEIRPDFLEIGRRNLEASGLLEWVDLKQADINQGIAENDVDAVVLDLPEPSKAVPHARAALKVGGHFACYTPLIQQAEEAVRALRAEGFANIRTLETLQREMEIGEHGSRPSFEMLGHTGYLTFARRL